MLLVFSFLGKLPAADDRGHRAPALDVVVIKREINVNDDEDHKEPQEQVVPEAHAELAAHEGNDPGKHAGQERRAHAGVKREAGNRLWFGRHFRLVNLTPTARSAKTLALSAASGQKRLLFSTRR